MALAKPVNNFVVDLIRKHDILSGDIADNREIRVYIFCDLVFRYAFDDNRRDYPRFIASSSDRRIANRGVEMLKIR